MNSKLFRLRQLQNSFSIILQLSLIAFINNFQFAEASFSFTNLFQRKTDSVCIDNPEDFHILERFFKMGIYDEGLGFVLEGTKPISCRYLYSLEHFPISNDLESSIEEFEKALIVKNASRIWNKYFSESNNFVLKIVPLKNSDFECEVRFINLSLLKETIARHIDLFRYILGPSLEIEQLANRIASSDEELHNILNQDLVLIGIALGFGSHNSIVEGRIEKIQIPVSKDCAPFLPKSCLLQSKDDQGVKFLTPGQFGSYYLEFAGSADDSMFKSEYSPLRPSLGFTTIEEELSGLTEMEEPLPPCLEQKPAFVFGAYKKGSSNRNLFEKLEKSQKKIKSRLVESDFLEKIMKKMTGKVPSIKFDKSMNACSVVYKSVTTEEWIILLDRVIDQFESSEDRISFIEAFLQNTKSSPPPMIGATKGLLNGLNKALNNLSNANNRFEKLSQDNSLERVAPKQLYFKTTSPGTGKSLKENDRLRVNYAAEDFEGNVLFANSDTWVNVSQTVPGFAHGVQGMQIGEKRTLFVHPALAYGALTTLQPCIPLVIKVHLLDVEDHPVKALQPLLPLDLSWLHNPKLYRSIEKSIEEMPRFRGSSYRKLIDKFEYLDRDKIDTALKNRALQEALN